MRLPSLSARWRWWLLLPVSLLGLAAAVLALLGLARVLAALCPLGSPEQTCEPWGTHLRTLMFYFGLLALPLAAIIPAVMMAPAHKVRVAALGCIVVLVFLFVG